MLYVNKKGFGLIEVLIGLALMSISSIIFLSFVENSNKAVYSNKINMEETLLKQRVVSLLSNPARCVSSLTQAFPAPEGGGAPVIQPGDALYNDPVGPHSFSSIRINADTPTEIVTGNTISGMSIGNLTLRDGETTNLPSGGRTIEAILAMNITRPEATYGVRNKVLEFRLTAQYDNAGVLTRCGVTTDASVNLQEVCEELFPGFTFNNGTCQPPGAPQELADLLNGFKSEFCALDRIAVLTGKTPGPYCDPPIKVEDVDPIIISTDKVWEVPSGIIGGTITVSLVGGGGAGRSGMCPAVGNNAGGFGGSAGRFQLNKIIAVQPGQKCVVTIGSGGVAPSSPGFCGVNGEGDPGKQTKIVCPAQTLTADGGPGGKDVNKAGTSGPAELYKGKAGQSSAIFGQGGGPGGAGGNISSDGSSAFNFGSGGGGGGSASGMDPNSIGKGGNGQKGAVRITYRGITN